MKTATDKELSYLILSWMKKKTTKNRNRKLSELRCAQPNLLNPGFAETMVLVLGISTRPIFFSVS